MCGGLPIFIGRLAVLGGRGSAIADRIVPLEALWGGAAARRSTGTDGDLGDRLP
jgi:hypothetical protein